MTSEIRTNSLKSRAGLSTVTMTDSGPMFSGITTFVDNSGFTFGVGGGTSIFTPATNVLTFGTNNTEKIRIDASGHMHGVGVITATHFYGDGSNLTGISAGTSLSGSTNNTVCTVTGANAIQGEANLTFDGNDLTITGTAPCVNLTDTDSDDYKISNTQGVLAIRDTTAGADRFVINDNGTGYFLSNFQIGSTTSSPGATLHVKTSYPSLKVDSGGHASDAYVRIISGNAQNSRVDFGDSDDDDIGMIDYDHANNSMRFLTSATERMRINSDGTVYFSENIASQSPNGQFGFRMDRGGGNGTRLHVENLNNDSVNNNAEIRLVTNHSNCRMVHHNQGGFYVIQSASGYLHYYQNGISRVYIDPNGRVGVNYTGTAGWAEQLNVRGTYGSGEYAIAAHITHSQGSLMRFGTSSGLCGSIYGNGTGCSFNTSSDYRLKENDVNITDGISRVKQLRPIRFNWKSDPSKIEDGFFAHEVSPVVPESVTGEKDAEIDEIGEGYQKIDHSKLVPLLTASLREIITKVETLEQENNALRVRVTNLEGN